MAIQVRPGYISPLAMTAGKKAAPKLGQPAVRQTEQADKAAELQAKRQQLQNQMLLLRATGTDAAGAAEETQKVVAEKLEKVTAELRSANRNGVPAAEQVEQARPDPHSAAGTAKDWYAPKKADAASPGVYHVERDEEGYRISFRPYAEN